MRKNHKIVFIIAILFIVSLVAWARYSFVKNQMALETNLPNTPLLIPPVIQTGNPLAEIDYTSLEKDKLYTEEEGTYANLNEAGKKLLRAILLPPECVINPDGKYCNDYEWITVNSSIIALKDGMLLLNVPNGKGGASYKVYDLNKKRVPIESASKSHFGTKVRDAEFIIFVSNPNKWENRTTQNLLYYKFGMSNFEPIPLSEILPAESYWYYGGLGSEILEASLKDGVLNITIFNKWEGEIGITIPKKLRDVTFDLNNL